MSGGVLIFGLSHVGLRIAEILNDTGAKVFVAADARQQSAVLHGKAIELVFSGRCDLAALKTIDLTPYESIVLPGENELFNLQAALFIREINPDIRIVVRLFNLNLGRKLEASIKNIRVLSVSAAASSSFATSALIERPIRSFKINGLIMVTYKVKGSAFEGKTVLDIESARDIKVVAVNDIVFPNVLADKATIAADDDLVLFSTYATAKEVSGVRQSDARHHTVKRHRSSLFNRWQIDTVLLYTLLALIGIAAFSVSYFHHSERLSLVDSLYFVITVLTTVGFGDINLKDSALGAKAVGMILMLSGVSLSAILFAIITGGLIKKRLELFMGRKRMGLKGHIILCGFGDVGVRVFEDLIALNEKVLVIEKNPENKYIQILRQSNVPFIISDAALEETLRLANLRHAKSIICATDDDMKNLEIGLNARAVKSHMRVVLRIFDSEFAQMIQKHFNIHVALSSAAIAAPTFASASDVEHESANMEIHAIINVHGQRLAIAAYGKDIQGNAANGNIIPLFFVNNNGEISFNTIGLSQWDKLYCMIKWGGNNA
ncbi:potassium channel family protein [Candidatus Magnetominusculus xianensis]|uniref:Potassium transporter TrkA n=1 Tax=Candidatus Magnetominusculus xianensis TaxID=1748249 RepID=A0ABR5SAT2_9BACT|nr:potassium channel family protein [Candidatus Magnetominusculus xianensis]KWT74917.1 potassium transporter TrkA [Candidatus Magnetominusculus xianensis]MBF0405537.1 NAD-binding protein [Nitrospirota bacterium]